MSLEVVWHYSWTVLIQPLGSPGIGEKAVKIFLKMLFLMDVVLIVVGCQKQAARHKPQEPQQVYYAFHREMSSKNLNKALQYLVPEARGIFEQLAARMAKFETKPDKNQSEDPLVVFEKRINIHQWPNLSDIKLLQKDEKQASLQVQMGQCDDKKTESKENDECRTEVVTLRNHDGAWLIEIEFPEAMRKALER